MDDHVPKIHHHPAIAGQALFFALFVVLFTCLIEHGTGKGVQHAVTGAGADHKIVCK